MDQWCNYSLILSSLNWLDYFLFKEGKRKDKGPVVVQAEVAARSFGRA
jgi:hypothetical protein